MAQSRPTTTTDGAKALGREISSGGGGEDVDELGAWCIIDQNAGGWVDGTAGAYAQAPLSTGVIEQSGGFTVINPTTLELPLGLFVVEWSFDFSFPFLGAYGGYFGLGWTLWQGGPLAIANTVKNYTSYSEMILLPVQFLNAGGGNGLLASTEFNIYAWRGIVRSGPGSGRRLSLGIVDFYDYFPAAVDFSAGFSAPLDDAHLGSGNQNIVIASVGS
jgi:hypothetical protein